MTNKEWFKEAKFGMMIHWGLYSLLAGEYNGQRYDYNDEMVKGWDPVGEWIMPRYEIPIKEYEKLAQAFNPVFFDADEWVALAKEAGMKYIVITSKHHEGFALFKSEADPFNVVDATPFKRDIIKELADACKRADMKFGLYYSQELDWHEEHGGGYNITEKDLKGCRWSNHWDFPEGEKDYSICFEKKIKPQVKEILTKYGDLCLIWFDTPGVITPEQSMELYDMVKKYQPNALVNSRIGNGVGDYFSCGDNEIPDDYMTTLYESACTLNDTWGYKSFDNNWKSAEEVFKIKEHLNERGINYLLNVGPDGLGRIPAPTIEIFKKLGALLREKEAKKGE
ncbi:MAG: alpha-L-fucosidase [Clostridia bacterium]|nr:alpha-L-fucosidase [Clostridia bacterium]